MKDKVWNLLVAMFVIIASQAVLIVGILMGGSAGAMGVAAVGGGLIGIMAGIVMGILAIFSSRKSGTLAD